jgi:putative ABC transport system ATP-binding protein
MSALLSLEHIVKRHEIGRSSRLVLDDVSFSLDPRELVAVWGMPRSGRSTLLRIAAGIEPPDAGRVRFEGRELGRSFPGGHDALGRGIGYCSSRLRDREGRRVLEELTIGLLARGLPHAAASTRARAALERVGAPDHAEHGLHELDGAETVRVGLARALTLAPALLVIDEPITGVDLMDRDGVLSLLRSLADDDGIAVLMTVGETTGLSGADRALKIGGGGLNGSLTPELAPVTDLLLRRQAHA